MRALRVYLMIMISLSEISINCLAHAIDRWLGLVVVPKPKDRSPLCQRI